MDRLPTSLFFIAEKWQENAQNKCAKYKYRFLFFFVTILMLQAEDAG